MQSHVHIHTHDCDHTAQQSNDAVDAGVGKNKLPKLT